MNVTAQSAIIFTEIYLVFQYFLRFSCDCKIELPFSSEKISHQSCAFHFAHTTDDFRNMTDVRVTRNVPNRTACTQFGIPRAEHDSSDMRLQARAGAHRARLQSNNQRAIGKIPRTKRPSGLRHGLDLSVRQRIGMRLTQITPPTNHCPPSVKHDGTDRHLTLRCGFTSQLDRKSHVVTPLHIRHYTVPFT